MRRNAALVALLVLVAPLAARVAAASRVPDAACALVCAKGMGSENGAACCPMGHGAALPTLSSCAHDGDGVPLPAALGPMLLAAALILRLPSASGRLRLVPALALPFPPARLLDKVPLFAD